MSSAKVAILFTGGTISMTRSGPDGSAIPTLVADDISRAIPELDEFNLEMHDFGQYPGPHMGPERCFELLSRIEQAVDEGCDGVVVTHGTDTLEESAFFVDLLYASPQPVIFVGAMRTQDDLSWDGPINLFSSCLVAANAASRERGVMVVMNNVVHAASEVTKTYTEALDTFVSPDTGPLGILDTQQLLYYRKPVRRRTLPMVQRGARVEVIYVHAASDGDLVEAAVRLGYEGLVIAAMGRGNVSPAMADAIVEALKHGVHVVITSRCWGGRVGPIYGYPGGGATLLEAGAFFAPWHNPQKARIMLSLALAAYFDAAGLRHLFGGATQPN